MSLINTIGKITVNQVDEEFKKAINMSAMIAHQLESSHTALFNLIWKNRVVTIEQMLEKYGTDATKLFQVSGAIQDVLIAVNPNYKPLVPLKPVTFHEDGTVTIQV